MLKIATELFALGLYTNFSQAVVSFNLSGTGTVSLSTLSVFDVKASHAGNIAFGPVSDSASFAYYFPIETNNLLTISTSSDSGIINNVTMSRPVTLEMSAWYNDLMFSLASVEPFSGQTSAVSVSPVSGVLTVLTTPLSVEAFLPGASKCSAQPHHPICYFVVVSEIDMLEHVWALNVSNKASLVMDYTLSLDGAGFISICPWWPASVDSERVLAIAEITDPSGKSHLALVDVGTVGGSSTVLANLPAVYGPMQGNMVASADGCKVYILTVVGVPGVTARLQTYVLLRKYRDTPTYIYADLFLVI
jgi:hypothetical protein